MDVGTRAARARYTALPVTSGRKVALGCALAAASLLTTVGTAAQASSTGKGGGMLAFPDAQGNGRFARGGRGGRIVIVDTREDVVDARDGRTSLREALEIFEGPRTIVFGVGGTFDTGSRTIIMSNEADSFVTVACQSAPAPGVLIMGNGIRIRGGAHDIVMRHCAIRNKAQGKPYDESSRALAVVASGAPIGNMVFDHLSLGWAPDENFTAFVGPSAKHPLKDITLSRSIVAEGDADSEHSESGQLPVRYLHSMGPSCNSASKRFRVEGCSIIGNFIAHNGRRNPQIWGTSGEVLNNVIYNWQETGLDVLPRQSGRVDVHVRGNEFKSGPTTRPDKPAMRFSKRKGSAIHYRVSDNVFVNGQTGNRGPLKNTSVGSPDRKMNEALAFDAACVGASRPSRASFDSRVLAEYRDSGGRVGIDSNDRRDFRGYEPSSHPAAYDTDRDGMADDWERRTGLDPSDPNDFLDDRDKDGYTNVEEFLNELGAC